MYVRINKIRRLIDTVRYLRVSQILNRIARTIPLRRIPPVPDVHRRFLQNRDTAFVRRPKSILDERSVRFLGDTGFIDTANDWNHQDLSRLWLYNLHYFDGLLAREAETGAEVKLSLVTRWIDENPPGEGTGWEPYPTSLRICNWIKWICESGIQSHEIDQSLALQTAWLSRNIEWHLLGNHLFENARALVFSGHYFQGAAADEWLATGLRILDRELSEQILNDGGQFERSPMYHLIALEGLLDLINLSTMTPRRIPDAILELWRGISARMIRWMLAMCHPDGGIALFNDSAFEIASSPDELTAYARRLHVDVLGDVPNLVHLVDSGYVRSDSPDALLIADVGEIGPDYLPGHAHADTLSFELSLFGQRCIVDSGCSTYEASAERLRQRGTNAHNTVTVDNEDSSEVWSSFRVARRARPGGVMISERASSVVVEASHDGYMRFSGEVMHFRRWTHESNRVEVRDVLTGTWRSAQATLVFHPDVLLSWQDGIICFTIARREVKLRVCGGNLRIERTSWHPKFGVAIPTSWLCIEFERDELITTLEWQ